jgi:hypothetical protein
MWNDPIVEEVRRAREEYAARFDHDLDAIFRDLQDCQDEAREDGWTIVSLPPRPPAPSDHAA